MNRKRKENEQRMDKLYQWVEEFNYRMERPRRPFDPERVEGYLVNMIEVEACENQEILWKDFDFERALPPIETPPDFAELLRVGDVFMVGMVPFEGIWRFVYISTPYETGGF